MRKFAGLLAVCLALTMVLAGCSQKKENTSYIVLDDALAAEEYGIGFRNGDIALGMAVQNTLDEMIADGKAAEISNVWFGSDMLLKSTEYIEDTAIPAGDTSLQAILDRGTFILGLDDSFPPMGYRNDKNEVVGFDIDLAREVCARLGVELVIQPIDWNSKELELNSGKIDCIWNGMTINPDRVANMFIPKAYIANRQVVIVGNASGIQNIAGLKDKLIGLQKGSSALDALNADPISSQVKSVTEYDENISAFLDLKAGRVDAFVVDEAMGRYMISQDAAVK